MWIQQVLVSALCILLAAQQITAVVNTGTSTKTAAEPSSDDQTNAATQEGTEGVSDTVAASTETEADKRESVIDLTGNFPSFGLLDGGYGAPLDSYLPPTTGNIDLPIPVYGVPNIGANIIYPAPPPDVPPPLPLQYGVPNGISLPPKDIYGPPKFTYGPPKHRPQKFKYGPPQQRPPKPFNPPPFRPPKGPKPHYGPPRFHKPQFPKPKPSYGPPKLQYGPPKPQYGPPKPVHLPPKPIYIPSGPSPTPINLSPPPLGNVYGPPTISTINLNIIKDIPHHHPSKQYGPPEPVPHSPPPGVPAPPTPPDIKYDGWQPIPGLVSNHHHQAEAHGSIDYSHTQGGVGSLGLQDSYNANGAVSDSYGAPLNTVTGSGGVVATSGDDHHQQGHHEFAFNNHQQSQQGFNVNNHQQSQQEFNVNNHQQGHQEFSFNNQHSQHNQQEQHHEDHQTLSLGLQAIGLEGHDNSLSVVKSVGYELHPSYAFGYASGYSGQHGGDSYSAPPANSYSPDGPYPAAQGYKFQSNNFAHGYDSVNSVNAAFGSNVFSKEISLSPNGIGLIPPSGVYGVAPSSQYGTPLFQPARHHFKGGPPKHPVIFREPVPSGLIQSIGNEVAHNDAHGIISSAHANQGPTYIPPPVPEITKPVKEDFREPSDLYSLPHVERPISFQSVVHGSPTAGLAPEIANFNGNQDSQQSFHQNQQQFSGSFGSHSQQFSFNQQQGHHSDGYNANLGSLDGAYALPLQSAPVTFNTEQKNNGAFQVNQIGNGGYDFSQASSHGYTNNFGYQHDCNSHSSQPLPQLTYGVPSANTYTAALQSLKTNIGGGYQGQPALVYGTPDLAGSHSTLKASSSSSNSISEAAKEVYAKSFGESFAAGGELVQSQSLDLNNIPIQGNLGSYTLQIQSADGLGATGASSNNVPHDQVLNDGLLQSILAAIEQPHQNGGNNGQLIQGYHNLEVRSDGDGEASLKNAVVVDAPSTQAPTTNKTESKDESDEEGVDLVDDNEIALYFKNAENKDEKKESEKTKEGGSYVSFKTPNTSYNYDLKSTDKEDNSG